MSTLNILDYKSFASVTAIEDLNTKKVTFFFFKYLLDRTSLPGTVVSQITTRGWMIFF